ncbi:MAG: glutaredoxin family protein [Herminiimonas sp.]|nr:glutaredoxin family protein [Herminiimonas sp.]
MSSRLDSPARLPGLLLTLLLALLLGHGTVHAQVFKWVGPDGKINYGDMPPATQRAEKKSLTANVLDNAALPFAVAEAARLHPVTFYTGTGCAPCDAGRKYLATRGIPFTEKSVTTNADIALLGGAQVELPQLTVGSSKLTGFEAGAWDARLSAAGYPASNKLSRNYRNPAPSALAPVTAEATERKDTGGSTDGPTAPAAASLRPKAQVKPAAPPRTDPAIPGLRF